MTTIDRPNREILDKAIGIYRDAMRGFLVTNLRRVPEKSVEQAVEGGLLRWNRTRRAEQFTNHLRGGGTVESFIDTADIPPLLAVYWKDVFGGVVGNRDLQTDCQQINNVRNSVAHPSGHDFNFSETYVALYHMGQALRKINASKMRRTISRSG